jgi:hypothetical protein
VIIPGTGHTAGGTGCGQRIMREFIEKGSAAALDTSCVDKVKRPAFFLSPAGPDPNRTSPPSPSASDSAKATSDKSAGQAAK